MGKSQVAVFADLHGINSPNITNFIIFLFLKDFIYLFMKETHTQGEREREAETQAEGEAGFTQGAGRGTRSRVSRIKPWAEGGAKLLSHPGWPFDYSLI